MGYPSHGLFRHHSIANRRMGISLLEGQCDPERAAASALGLQFHQPVCRLGEDRESGELAPHHGDFVAVVIPGTDVAVLVNLVGEILAARKGESLARKKFGGAREKADAIHAMPLGFG